MFRQTKHKHIYISTLIAVLFIFAVVVAGCGNPVAADTAQPPAAKVAAVQQVSTATQTTQLQAAPAPAVGMAVDQEALADLYDRIVPSVVNIQVTLANDLQGMNPKDLPYGFPGMPDIPRRGEGSGFVYDEEGHIITNNHVVEGAEEVIVVFDNGLWTEAEVVATDPQSDLAVLKVDAPEGVDLNPLPLAEPDSLRVGYSVIAIGDPFGLESTMTTGIISALGRSFPVGDGNGGNYTLPAVIQTDAAINPGNSGGPLLNLKGEVAGVNFAIESPVRASAGVGFAIPVSIVERIVPALIENGEYNYPYLGIAGQSITPQLEQALDLPENVLGAYVSNVAPGGPADKGGVKAGTRMVDVDGVQMRAGGDIIVAIDDQPVRSFEDLVSYLVRETEPGQDVTLTVYRDGDLKELQVQLGERPQTMVETPTQAVEGISSKAAIAIARDTVQQENLLEGSITETIVTQEDRNGRPVWVVELSDGKATATIVIDVKTGDVLNATVES